MPYRGSTVPSLTVRAGYLVPSAYASLIADKLDLHGLAYQTLEHSSDCLDAKVFRTTGTGFASAPVEGRMPLALQGDWQPEPQAPDSLVAWGYFNAHFEHKEYVEPYVTEIFAQQRQGLGRAGAAKAPVRPRKRIPLTTLRWLDQRPPRCPVLGRYGTSLGHSSTVRSPLPCPCRRAGAAAVARSAGHALAEAARAGQPAARVS